IADINECEGTRGVDFHQDCHNCTNAIGSYTCGCRGGYELDPETKKMCIGEIPPEFCKWLSAKKEMQ
ncbi:hypothetical protein CAPTEDRAFT_110230, partial [Capitella teleta]